MRATNRSRRTPKPHSVRGIWHNPPALSAAPNVELDADEPLVVAIVPIADRDGPGGGASGYYVSCAGHDCGLTFRIAARTLRDLKTQGRLPYCPDCRRPARVNVTEADRQFWTRRFSESEYVALAEAMFGPRDEWTPSTRADLALAASAARPRV